jgi:oxygen-independent coproporphyrinogen-3 oxidase
MNTLKVNLDLIKKYNVPAPRYTSYPPATRFSETVSSDLIREKIGANNTVARDLSLYCHLPFCKSLCWYCGCTTVITTQPGVASTYLRYLKREVALMAQRLHPNRRVVQFHLGGGTPTYLSADELRTLGDIFREHFNFAENAENGVEIDPRRLSQDHLAALREIGFNRASVGVQDHNPKVQSAVHRIQPFAETKMAVDWIRAAGFKSVNLDLIYGLPFQTVVSFEKTLDDLLNLQPDRLAVFSYAHLPALKPAQRIFTDEMLPSSEVKLQILKLTIEKLTAAGFVYIGMDHFARADDELAIAQREKTLQRNFQGYSTHSGADIYSFGMSAISQTECAYWQNLKDLPAYYAALNAGQLPLAKGYILTEDDKIRRQTIMRLMCDLTLDFAAMSQYMESDFKTYFARELASLDDLEADGLIVQSERGLTVTDFGRLLIRNIASRFDAAYAQRPPTAFSKAI